MIENSFLESGFGFTTSKVLPYIITLLIGLIIVFLLRSKLRFKSKALRISVKVIIAVIPFIIYFIINPIYDGDFSNNFEIVKSSTETNEISENKLIVLTIPGCPYCKQAMDRMLMLKDRNPNLEIEFIVCHIDSTSLDFYKEVSKGVIPVNLAKKPAELAELANHKFPTFIYSEKSGELKRWSNDNFGVRALDFIEDIANK